MLRKIMMIIFLILLVISSVEIVKWFKSNQENEKLQEEISQAITINETEQVEEKTYNIDFAKLKEMNSDTVAWVKVEGTDVEYTVVQANNNDYYLNHNFEKQYNSAGWIFADYKNKLDGTDKNIIVYGHNRRDGSMFASLKNILKEEWYTNEENRKVTFVTEDEYSTYEVFSVYQIEREEYYLTTSFANGEFREFIENIKNRSTVDFNVDVTEADRILTLSTCANDNKYRVVLHAKKI